MYSGTLATRVVYFLLYLSLLTQTQVRLLLALSFHRRAARTLG
jgi:hypothetical protein